MAKSYTKNVLNINKHQGNLTEATLRYYPTLEWLLFKKKNVLAKMWSKGNPCTLLEEMFSGTVETVWRPL